jgi:ABC-type Na+ efflux pump permease subunit
MRLKRKVKKKLRISLIIIIVILILIAGLFTYYKLNSNETVTEAKVVSSVDKYGYELKDNKSKKYQTMFAELKDILSKSKVDEEEYVKKISEMFIYDFYTLNDKTAKTDIGGVDFVYPDILENFLQNAQDTYYKYVESNIYNNRKQSLPEVSNIEIESVDTEEFAYGEKTDSEAYKVTVKWSYTDDSFSDYQKEATLIFIHDDIKLYLVELQ